MRRVYIPLLVVLSIQFGVAQDFTEISEQAGINHAFEVDLATFGGGAAVLDFDKDGYEDVYITGGNTNDVLYKNNGDGTFSNVFDGSGLESTIPIHTQGVAAADVNRDGFKDLLVTTMHYEADRVLAPNLLFLNDGDGTFTDVTKEYGLDKYVAVSMGASFGDINADGYPDLYIANYFGTSLEGVSVFNEQTITNGFAPAIDFLFINASGASFVEASGMYGMDHDGFGFEGTFTDWDNDQDNDILIANDFGFKSTPNVALRNDFPEKKLTEKSNSLVLNYGMNAMGIAVGDYNFDGWMDYYVTNIASSILTANLGGDSFENVAPQTGTAIQTIQNEDYMGVPISWGANFFDFDHDMDLDLFVCNGALNPTLRLNHNFFFELENGVFEEVAPEKGLDDPRIGRGSVVFDYDNDGDLDLLVVNQIPREVLGSMPPARCLLYRNDAAQGNWLKVKLEGLKAEKDGLGSRIEVTVGGKTLIREIDGGSSHLSQNSTIAHFGLDYSESVESIVVKWIGGKTQTLTNIAANQTITIQEEEGSIFSFDDTKLTLFPGFFTNSITMEFELEEEEAYSIYVYDSQGRQIKTLTEENTSGNSGFWHWNINQDLTPGVYIFQLKTKNHSISKRAVKLN